MKNDPLAKKIDLLEKVISKADERVGKLLSENRLLKQQLERLTHQVADKSRQLAVLEQAEEKFVELRNETALLRGQRKELKSEVEHLLRKLAALKATVLQLD
jgi:DICT domain-containing protein